MSHLSILPHHRLSPPVLVLSRQFTATLRLRPTSITGSLIRQISPIAAHHHHHHHYNSNPELPFVPREHTNGNNEQTGTEPCKKEESNSQEVDNTLMAALAGWTVEKWKFTLPLALGLCALVLAYLRQLLQFATKNAQGFTLVGGMLTASYHFIETGRKVNAKKVKK